MAHCLWGMRIEQQLTETAFPKVVMVTDGNDAASGSGETCRNMAWPPDQAWTACLTD